MTDPLLSVAKRLGVPTDMSAGPGATVAGVNIWARWPRHRLEVAQDVLNQLSEDGEARVTPIGASPLWRAQRGDWTYIGRFEDAVTHLAEHVTHQR
jgi:hypothetical protein